MHTNVSMNRILILILVLGVPMFSFAKEYKVVEVKFYEDESKKPFAISNVPIDQLPDTFEIDTTMHLGEEDWSVLGAEPARKTKFMKSGKLKLYLSKVEISTIDPNEILYSLPTVSNDFAGLENATSLKNVLVLQEDDWRQFEFMSHNYETLIERELKSISDIYKNHREGLGFKEIHVRKMIKIPLANSKLTINTIKSSFSIEKVYSGVAFNNAAATIVGGFAFFSKSGWLLWGQADDSGDVLVFNLTQTKESKVLEISGEIDSFTKKNDLYLVDWPRLFWCGSGKLNFAQYEE